MGWRTCSGRRARCARECGKLYGSPFAVASRRPTRADDHSRSFSWLQIVSSSMTSIERKLLQQLRMELGPGIEKAMKKSVKLGRN